MNITRAAPALALIFTAAVICASCGGDDGSSVTPSVSATVTPSPTATPRFTGVTPVPGPGVSPITITLGMTNDMSGSGDTPYAAVTVAMQAYFRKLNIEERGACGRDIRLFAEDDGYTPQVALEKTRELVEGGEVLAMVGGLSTEIHQATAPYLNDPNSDGDTGDGIPDLFISTGWSGWGDEQAYPWTIGYIPDYWTDGAVLGRYIAENLADTPLGVIYQDDLFGRDYLAGLKAGLGDAEIVSEKAFPAGAPSVTDQLVRVRNDGAEAVVLVSPPEVSASAIVAAAVIDYSPHWLVSYTNAPSVLASMAGGGTSAEDLAAGFEMLGGTISTQYLLSTVEDENAPEIVEHVRIMQTYQGPPISSLSVYGQSLAELATEALRRSCNNLTRSGLLEAAESMEGFRTSLMLPGIEVTLGARDHRAIEALQPVRIEASGEVVPDGDAISVDDLPAPSAPPTPTPVATASS